jgi:hypothetical protein
MTETPNYKNLIFLRVPLCDRFIDRAKPTAVVNAQICPGCGERFCPDISADMDGSLCAACEEKLMDADTAWISQTAASGDE